MDNCGDKVDNFKIMFLGEYLYFIDQKGRIAIPPRFRKHLGKGAFLTRGIDSCLFLFPPQEWQKLVSQLLKLPISQKNSRAFVRLMLAGASEVKVDKQGRIIIPDYLKKYASLKKKAVVCGLYNRIEIWDEKKWQSYKMKTEKEAIDIAQELEGLI